MPNLPLKPIHGHEIENMLEVLSGMLVNRNAVYVSAPITTGRRLSEWHAKNNGDVNTSHPEYQDQLLKEVVEPNRAHAKLLVTRLRKSHPTKVVIDPTSVSDLPTWTQDDYLHLWGSIIERYVSQVFFMNDWQYSRGCAYEFMVAQQCRMKTFSEKGEKLTVDEGLRLIQQAMAEMGANAPQVTFLKGIVEKLLDQCSPKTKEALCLH